MVESQQQQQQQQQQPHQQHQQHNKSRMNRFLLVTVFVWLVALIVTILYSDNQSLTLSNTITTSTTAALSGTTGGSTAAHDNNNKIHIAHVERLAHTHSNNNYNKNDKHTTGSHHHHPHNDPIPLTIERDSGSDKNDSNNDNDSEVNERDDDNNNTNNKNDTWYTLDALDDQITGLPGLDVNPGFNQFSGYLEGSESTRHLFYWYVESQSNPSTDPVVLWTNGGPGCSGLLGFGTEHGPFRIDGNGTLTMNPYSWNRIANMLYIEQPAGVGFSYFDTNNDKYTGDDQSAKDNYYFILNFLQRFPERQKNPFYISSESYGGHYMPQLAMYILKNDFYHDLINFKGFMVGNPYVDPYTNTITQIRAYYNHGLIAKPLFDKWISLCENPISWDDDDCYQIQQDMYDSFGPGINPYALDYPVCFENPFIDGETYEFDLHPNMANSTQIRSSSSVPTSRVRLSKTNQIAHIDEYRRKYRINRNQHQRRLRKHGNRHRHHHHSRGKTPRKNSYDDDDFAVDDDYLSVKFDDELFNHYDKDDISTPDVPRAYSAQVDEFLYRNNVTNIIAPSFLPQADSTYKPCSQVHLERFLNKHDVRAALHVKDEGGFLWSACTDDIVYSNTDFDKSVIDEYKEIIKMSIARSPNGSWINNLNILIFSGDDDSIASTAGTQTWIWDLGIPPVSHDEWKPWIVDGQTAGFVVHFKVLGDSSFIFATVHGAGHEVPAYRPYEALELFARYLDRTL